MTQHNNGISFTVNGKTLYFSKKEVFNWNINGWLVSCSLYPVKYQIEKINNPYDFFDCDKLPPNYIYLESDLEAWELAKKEGFILNNGGYIIDWKPKTQLQVMNEYFKKNPEKLKEIQKEFTHPEEIFKIKASCANYERDNVETNIEILKSTGYLVDKKSDRIVEAVREKLLQRSKVGIQKYSTTIWDNTDENYIKHLQDELLDGANYCEQQMRVGKFSAEVCALIELESNDCDLGTGIRKLYNKLMENGK